MLEMAGACSGADAYRSRANEERIVTVRSTMNIIDEISLADLPLRVLRCCRPHQHSSRVCASTVPANAIKEEVRMRVRYATSINDGTTAQHCACARCQGCELQKLRQNWLRGHRQHTVTCLTCRCQVSHIWRALLCSQW